MATEDRPVTNYIALLEQLGKTTTLIAAIMLVMSVCYDFAFIHALGLSFNEIPSTTAEHLRSALLWVPYIAMVAAGLTFHELLAGRIEDGETEDEIVTNISPKSRTFRRLSIIFSVLAVGMPVLAMPFYVVGIAWVYIFGMTAWVVLATSLVIHKRFLPKFSLGGAIAFVGVPALFGLVAFIGDVNGTKLITAVQPQWEITLRSGGSESKRTVLGIRRFSTFAITVELDRSVTVIPNDAIFAMKRLGSPLSNLPNMCRWFSVGCTVLKRMQ